MEVLLERLAITKEGTFGVLKVYDPQGTMLYKCYTVERPWIDNQRNISCIPKGRYKLRKTTFYRNTPDTSDDYEVYEICNVPDRSNIKIHIGNTMLDTAGCVIVGQQLGVLGSRVAFNQFMSDMGGVEEANITIIEVLS